MPLLFQTQLSKTRRSKHGEQTTQLLRESEGVIHLLLEGEAVAADR